MNLDGLGIATTTDKSSVFHSYLPLYQKLFSGFREPVTLLEIGIQFGNSIKVWKQYWPHSLIIGMDSVDNRIFGLESDRCHLYFRDAYTNESVALMGNYRPFNIIIDDGSHLVEHQQFVIKNYSWLLGPNGLLIVEDVPGMETVQTLVESVPPEFFHATIDLRTAQQNTQDSILFLVWRK